jgi:hypothetical protein
MHLTIFFICLAILLRLGAALFRHDNTQKALLIISWPLGLISIWLVGVTLNFWSPLWPVLLFTFIGIILEWFTESPIWYVGLSAMLLLVLGLLSIPPASPLLLIVALLLLTAVAASVDWLAQQLPLKLLAGGVTTAVLTVIIAFTIWPGLRHASSDLLNSLVYADVPTIRANSEAADIAGYQADRPHSMALDDPRQVPEFSGTQWAPYLEWHITNPDYEGNPFDLIASVTFTHTVSGATHTTQMFYDTNDTWHFRFTGTEVGEWTFTTSSVDPDLDSYRGTIQIEANPGVAGFVTHYGNKWGRQGIDRAFIPQFAMIGAPHTYYDNPAEIEAFIDIFLVEHGFNGLHSPVFCRWFDISQQRCSNIHVDDPNPDPRTFAALEELITAVHAQGGVVHIWMWGDDSRRENPKRWGLNGEADKRLQRYIAARLGPLPGWTMGYGYDLWEWVTEAELDEWHAYMHQHLGWPKYLGARASKNQLNQLSERMDYSAYEQHRPDYEMYVETIAARPDRPSFSEDRFRIREEAWDKDYDEEMTRRGLWHSAMAGGVANIWGNLIGAAEANNTLRASAPYLNPHWIKTYALFFEDRFWADMTRCNELTNGYCLQRTTGRHYLFYDEATDLIEFDLSEMQGAQPVIAIDSLRPYKEINLGLFSRGPHQWTAPYESDWAIAVGDFQETSTEPAAVSTPSAYSGCDDGRP